MVALSTLVLSAKSSVFRGTVQQNGSSLAVFDMTTDDGGVGVRLWSEVAAVAYSTSDTAAIELCNSDYDKPLHASAALFPATGCWLLQGR